jgi:RimJ/RimL family protein N-acetyltransferase
LGAEVLTERLLLRRWRPQDREPFAAMNADPEVMEHFSELLSRRQSDALVDSIEAGFERRGFGFWALELRESGEFVGFTGLAVPRFEAHFTPAIEVGWRLARQAWGNGYATEAGRASLAQGFERHGLAEIVSFTSARNLRSQAVMARLGMSHDPADDFDHPLLAADDPLRRHVLYRVRRPERETASGELSPA